MFPFSSPRTHALCTRTSLNDAPQRECEVFCMCTPTQRQQALAIELTEHTSPGYDIDYIQHNNNGRATTRTSTYTPLTPLGLPTLPT